MSLVNKICTTALLLAGFVTLGCEAPKPEATGSFRDCAPGEPCATPFEVKVVIVAMFEIGEDEGDTAGEFQLWKARENLTARIAFPHGHHDLFLSLIHI